MEGKMGQKNLLVVLVVLGLVVMILGIFVVPRDINYDPRPGLKPQLLLDLDPDSNELSLFAEGITSDEDGNLYIGDNTGKISRIDPGTGKMEVVGKVVADGEGVGLFGIKFDHDGNLYVATGSRGEVWRLLKDDINAASPGNAKIYKSGLKFANDIAFDNFGRMFVSDSINGILWEVDMASKQQKEFANQLTSRDPTFPFGINGLAFDDDGTLYFSNTGNGVIHKVETRKEDGAIVSVTVWRSHEALIGADGIAFDKAGNLWIATNRRNAIMAITPEGDGGRRIIEVAKNDNTGPLEFPSSVAFSGESIYITNFDIGGMGDNEDSSPGIGPSIVKIQLGVEGLPSPP